MNRPSWAVNLPDNIYQQILRIIKVIPGFATYIEVSGEHGIGFYELKDEIIKNLNKKESYTEDKRLKFSVVGRPNVGKSSLINALLNEERVIVSDEAGTTRDAIDTVMKYNDQEYVVIDTAGKIKKL